MAPQKRLAVFDRAVRRRRVATAWAIPLLMSAAFGSETTLMARGTAAIVQTPTGGISGLVVACDGNPTSNVQVGIPTLGIGAMANAQGRFLLSGVPAGTHQLSIERLGFGIGAASVTVTAGQTVDVGRLPAGCDQIRLARTPTTADVPSSTAVVVDYGNDLGACVRDFVAGDGGSSEAVFPFSANLVQAVTCNSEIAAFSVGNGPHFASAPIAWSSALGDVHSGALGAQLTVPLNVWLVLPPGDHAEATERSLDQFLTAVDLFDRNRVGVTFTHTVTGASSFVSTVSTNCAAAIANGVQSSAAYVSGQLNVYYVAQVLVSDGATLSAGWGVSCDDDPNIILIDVKQPESSILAHEIGHAFGLRGSRGHTNWTLSIAHTDAACTDDLITTSDWPDCEPPCLADWDGDVDGVLPGCQKFLPRNVMHSGFVSRDHFTLGQAYHMLLTATSRLNANGHRTGPTKACGERFWERLPCPYPWIDPS